MMVAARSSVAGLALLSFAACPTGNAGDPGAGEWVGTITSEGGVTKVVNESGSVWPGRGRLIEETAIGVEAGADEYMFGDLFALAVTDEHIYVTDEQADRVRRYDLDGVFIDNVGSIGQGPGEYGDPAMVAVTSDGRIIVFDFAGDRMQVYAPDGKPLDTWPSPKAGCCAWPMLTAADDALWVPTQEFDFEAGEARHGIQVFGPDGPAEPRYMVRKLGPPSQPLEVASRGSTTMPFAPQFTWTPAAPGRVLAGAADTYRFEVQERGETVRVVEKYWEPVPIDPEHLDWRRKTIVALGRRFDPGWTWNGAGMPTHLPAYSSLIAARSGETWVARYGASARVAECADPLAGAGPTSPVPTDPCWKETFVLDVFDAEGRFLGEVETPPGVTPHPLRFHVDGDRVVAVCENELGVYQVKRYRLVRPA
jgi:hypothetical protein